MAGLFVAGIENEIFHWIEGAIAPSGQFLVQQLGGSTYLCGREALNPELAHHVFGLPRGDALDVHLSHREHDGTRRSLPMFKGLRVKWIIPMTRRLGHLHCDGPGRCVDALGLIAVRIAASVRRALIASSLQVLLALNLHCQLVELTKELP